MKRDSIEDGWRRFPERLKELWGNGQSGPGDGLDEMMSQRSGAPPCAWHVLHSRSERCIQ